MDLDRLYAILADATVQLRKGPEVEQTAYATHIYAMPHESSAPAGLTKVDCVFLIIGVERERAATYRDELIAILETYPEPERLAGGPSYLEVGAVIGDQAAAFQLFALGEVLGLWKVITPRMLGFTKEADLIEMAGRGLVMISGYTRP